MAEEIRAGVRLTLDDRFSPAMKRAGIAVQGFGQKAAGVAAGVNRAFGGLAGTLATVGVGLGAAALIREGVGFNDAITRIATNVGVFGEEAAEFGRHLLKVAQDTKVPQQELVAFARAASESAVSLEDITENMALMGKLIQGVGVSGNDAGSLLSAFLNRDADADSLAEKLDNIVEIGGRLGNVGIPPFLRYLPAMLEAAGRTGLDEVENTFVAMNMLRMGTYSDARASNLYRAAMADFSKREVRDAIYRHVRLDGVRFEVNDAETGELKSFAEIMGALTRFAEAGNDPDLFERVLGLSPSTMSAWRLFGKHFEDTVRNLGDLGNTSGAVARRAQANAETALSNLNALRTAAAQFANDSLMRPVEWLVNVMNEHPTGLKYAVIGLAGAITAIKVGGGLVALIAQLRTMAALKNLQGTGGLDGGLARNIAPIPVFVTNMGPGMRKNIPSKKVAPGRGNRSSPRQTAPRRRPGPNPFLPPPPTTAGPARPGIPPAAPKPRIPPGTLGRLAGGAGLMAGYAALSAVPQMVSELRDIREDEYLSYRERGEATGGAVGETVGYVAGYGIGGAVGMGIGAALAGALKGAKLGTAIGTVVPLFGNIVGLVLGAGIGAALGLAGGRAGRAIGEAIGGAAATDAEAAKSITGISNPGIAGAPTGALQAFSPHFVNDLIVTPGGTFSTHPDDYILAMKNPASLLGANIPLPAGIRDEMRSIELVIREMPPVTVDGEIVLRSELVIDDRGHSLRQRVAANTTPYKFAVGSAAEARVTQ